MFVKSSVLNNVLAMQEAKRFFCVAFIYDKRDTYGRRSLRYHFDIYLFFAERREHLSRYARHVDSASYGADDGLISLKRHLTILSKLDESLREALLVVDRERDGRDGRGDNIDACSVLMKNTENSRHEANCVEKFRRLDVHDRDRTLEAQGFYCMTLPTALTEIRNDRGALVVGLECIQDLDRNTLAHRRKNCLRVQHLCTKKCELPRLFEGELWHDARGAYDTSVHISITRAPSAAPTTAAE